MSETYTVQCPSCGVIRTVWEKSGEATTGSYCARCRNTEMTRTKGAGIKKKADTGFMTTCKKPYLLTFDDDSQAYECGKALADEGCAICDRSKRMSEQWEEIRIEDVQPGDVARCNGREFPILHRGGMLQCNLNELYYTPEWLEKTFGVTFHRRVKREPRTFEFALTSTDIEICRLPGVAPVTRSTITFPGIYRIGARFRVTEILDDDGNGGGQ